MMWIAFAALCLAFAALHLLTFLNPPQCGASTGTMTGAADEEVPRPLLHSHSAADVLLPLAAVGVGVLLAAVAFIYRHPMGRHVGAVPVAAGAGNGLRSISGLVMFVLCVSAGTLEFFLFGEQAAGGGGGAGHAAQARALGLAALRALPGAATATFFLGMMLIFIGHIRAGGEGGGTGGAVDADGPIQGKALLLLLTKIAAGAAAALLVGLMAMALTLTLYGGAKY